MESPLELKTWPVFANVEFDFLAKVKSVWVYREFGGEGAITVTNEDEVFAIGSNKYGQHGVGHTQPATNPRKVPALSHKQVVEISFGDDFALALTQDGTIYSWGKNHRGQLGRETKIDGLTPMPIEGPLRGKMVTSIACGYWHSLALTDSGEVFAWGRNDEGQLGDGSRNYSKVPQKIQFIPEGCHAQQISCGCNFSIILLNDGRILSFGNSDYGQLGHGNNEDQSTPAIIKALRHTKIVSVCCGVCLVLALSDMGWLYSWGWNFYGQLGNGSTENSSVPTRIGDKNTRFTAIETNWNSEMSAALNQSNQTYVWGRCKGGEILTPTETQFKSLPEVFYFHSNEKLSMYPKAIIFTSSGTSEHQASESSSYFFLLWNPISWLGAGAFGSVVKAKFKKDGQLQAVKITKLHAGKVDERDQALGEIEILRTLSHVNVLKYYTGWSEKVDEAWLRKLKAAQISMKINPNESDDEVTFTKGATYLFIATELCPNGTLEEYIDSKKKNPKQSWEYFGQLCTGLAYIHAKKIIHRDLKPANIFIGKEGQVKIGDFGLARALEQSRYARTFAGTLFFMSPEQKNGKMYNNKIDIYAAGVILTLLMKDYGYSQKCIEYINALSNGQNVEDELDKLIQKMLSANPKDRPEARELVGLQCPIN